MAVTVTLVAAILSSADRLGPQLSGVVSTYPVILIVIGSFTHHQWGVDAVLRLQRGLTVSLANFVAFFLVVGLTLPMVGVLPAFGLAAVTALTTSSLLIAFNRRRARARLRGRGVRRARATAPTPASPAAPSPVRS